MVLAVAASAAAVTVSPAGAITGNFTPDTQHNYVVLIAFYDKDGNFLWRCSGSLLNERTVLTAGHCTDTKSGAVSAIVWASQEGGALLRYRGSEATLSKGGNLKGATPRSAALQTPPAPA